MLSRSKLHGRVQDMYGEVPVPQPLQEGRSFDFLRRDLRRAGNLLAGSDG